MNKSLPIVVPNAEYSVLPSAEEYIAFRKKYPKLAGAGTNAQAASAIPFIAAAHEHAETAPAISWKIGAAAETFEFNVPSYGYIRALWLDVQATGGAITAEWQTGDDHPFSILENVTFLDTNGAPIYGPLSGYNVFLSNLYGGYTYQQDVRALPLYEAGATTGNFRFQVRIPIEISHHDGTGCVGNQNAAAPYRVRLTIASEGTFYNKKVPGTLPTVKIQPILEAWSLPNAVDALGRPQSQLPPNYGTVQFWSERNVTGMGSGLNQVQVLRVGNLLRNVIFVGRENATYTLRNDEVFPEYPIINWDARQLFNESQAYRVTRGVESLETPIGATGSVGGRPTGVFPYTFDRTNQDRCGDDKPWLYLPTVEATRLEVTGTYKKGGNNVVLVNDIAPAEVNPTQRYALPSTTGFHPNPDFANPNQG